MAGDALLQLESTILFQTQSCKVKCASRLVVCGNRPPKMGPLRPDNNAAQAGQEG